MRLIGADCAAGQLGAEAWTRSKAEYDSLNAEAVFSDFVSKAKLVELAAEEIIEFSDSAVLAAAQDAKRDFARKIPHLWQALREELGESGDGSLTVTRRIGVLQSLANDKSTSGRAFGDYQTTTVAVCAGAKGIASPSSLPQPDLRDAGRRLLTLSNELRSIEPSKFNETSAQRKKDRCLSALRLQLGRTRDCLRVARSISDFFTQDNLTQVLRWSANPGSRYMAIERVRAWNGSLVVELERANAQVIRLRHRWKEPNLTALNELMVWARVSR